jgi:hypothetical protein
MIENGFYLYRASGIQYLFVTAAKSITRKLLAGKKNS